MVDETDHVDEHAVPDLQLKTTKSTTTPLLPASRIANDKAAVAEIYAPEYWVENVPLAQIRVFAPSHDPLAQCSLALLKRCGLRDVILARRDERFDVLTGAEIVDSAIYRFGAEATWAFTITNAKTGDERKAVLAGEKLIQRFSKKPSDQDFATWWHAQPEWMKTILVPLWPTYTCKALAGFFGMCLRSYHAPSNASSDATQECRSNEINISQR